MTETQTRFLPTSPMEDLPPLDSRALSLDIARETRRTVVDIMRGAEPTTILGVLLANQKEGATVESIAEKIGEAIGLVNWHIDKLEQEGLCVRVSTKGIIKVLPLAAYTERNA